MLKRTLALTSPPMRGDDVLEFEQQLVKAGWLQAKPDGVYDSLTAQAVFRSKYWLGYKRPDKKAGPSLQRFVIGTATPTDEMTARRKERMKKAAQKPKPQTRAERIIRKANSQVGIKEDPAGSNRVKFSEWYRLIGPWCAMYVTWVHVDAGFAGRTFVKGSRYASVPTLAGDARAGRNGLVLAPGPADGILACYDWQDDGVPDHIGICATDATLKRIAPKNYAAAIADFGPLAPGEFWSLEGNTSVDNDSNGGAVMIRKRGRQSVHTFARVTA